MTSPSPSARCARTREDAFTDEDLERYVEAWSQPGALTGMINYYRAALRRSPRKALAQLQPIEAPTLVIWGMRDRHLGSELAEPGARVGAQTCASSASPRPPTGCSTTRPSGSTSCCSTSSPKPSPKVVRQDSAGRGAVSRRAKGATPRKASRPMQATKRHVMAPTPSPARAPAQAITQPMIGPPIGVEP